MINQKELDRIFFNEIRARMRMAIQDKVVKQFIKEYLLACKGNTYKIEKFRFVISVEFPEHYSYLQKFLMLV